MTIRTVTIRLANSSGICANLKGLRISFHDEAAPHLTTTAKYQSATQTTDEFGVLTFSFDSSLSIGQSGLLTISGTGGVHYNDPWPVS